MEITVARGIRNWWVFLLRGILFVLVGIYMIVSPHTSYVALGFFFGLVILLAGVAELLRVTRDTGPANRGWHLFIGILDIILGIVLMGHIAASVAILRIIVGLWFLFKGISLAAFSGLSGRLWVLTLGGIITIFLGLMILFNASFGAMTIILWTAIAFILTGFANIMLSYRLKG